MSLFCYSRQVQRCSVNLYQQLKQFVSPLVTTAVQEVQQREGGIFEPDYLQVGKPKIPFYEKLNIQLKGYDYAVLEHFQRFVHKIAQNMDIEVEDGWAIPHQHMKIQRFKPQSTFLQAEYQMKIYERNIQVVNLPSTIGSIFFEVLQTALPEGVSLTVNEHQSEHEEKRYVPDLELIELKNLLEELGGPRKSK